MVIKGFLFWVESHKSLRSDVAQDGCSLPSHRLKLRLACCQSGVSSLLENKKKKLERCTTWTSYSLKCLFHLCWLAYGHRYFNQVVRSFLTENSVVKPLFVVNRCDPLVCNQTKYTNKKQIKTNITVLGNLWNRYSPFIWVSWRPIGCLQPFM